jgi:hypothetical protein
MTPVSGFIGVEGSHESGWPQGSNERREDRGYLSWRRVEARRIAGTAAYTWPTHEV